MMENEKILINLANQLEALQKQVLRMNTNNYSIHRLDIEILQNVIREMYEQVLELNESADKKPEVKEEIKVSVVPIEKVEKEVKLPEIKAIAKEEVLKEKIEITEPENPQVVEFEIEVENEIIEEIESKQIIQEKITQTPADVEVIKEEKRNLKSTIDLFSTTSEPTISDKFLQEKEPSIADKMMQSRISNLRQAIGINEKFLFINELFNGDMGKYNKALDELNDMKTKEGVVTYFIELKIHNQWKEDNEAFVKFKEILDRKME